MLSLLTRDIELQTLEYLLFVRVFHSRLVCNRLPPRYRSFAVDYHFGSHIANKQ